jgi:integrase
VQLGLLTGARYSELCRFDVRDFQESGTLFVRDSKSGKTRYIVLNEEGVHFCRQIIIGRLPSAPLIAKADGSRWERDHHHRPFKSALSRGGIDRLFTFHELRHTWASLTIMAGAPLMVVAQNLGHRDTRMVELHYGHLAESFVADTIRRTSPSFGLIGPTVMPMTPITSASPPQSLDDWAVVKASSLEARGLDRTPRM